MSRTKWIDRLTPDQVAQLPAYRDKWLHIGLSTEPASHAAAEQAIAAAYKVVGLAAPSMILWLSSPLHGAWLSAALSHGAQVGDQVRDQVWAQVWAQVGDQVGDQVYRAGYGSHDASWLAFYDFFSTACGLDSVARLQPLMTLAKDCGWFWPFAGVCIATEKPSVLHRDERGRLHCADGPALDYRGTWGVWAWHGVRVPQAIIEQPDTITAAMMLAERNSEIARVMLERMGIERFVAEANAQVLHQDVDGAGQPRRLLAVDMPSDPDRRIVAVEVQCPSTGHHYLLRVPPTMRNCTEAVAWTYGFTGKAVADYAPLVEA